MIRKALFCGAALGMLTVQLPSCGFTAGVETLLSPPRLTAEQEQIYQALQRSAGSQISLKYPKSGERLSAFIVEDLDGDDSDEAIVFYESGRNSAEENPLRLCLLDQRDGNWRAIREYPAAGAEIERVDVAQLGTNPRTNLIISYSMVDGAEHAAEVFHYADSTLTQTLSVQYSVMALRDLNRDGTMELFVASAAKAPTPAMATVYALDENGSYMQSQISLPDAFTDISRLVYGVLPTGNGQETIPAVYMDGTTGATTVQTVAMSYRGDRLWLEYADSADRFPNTERPGGCQTLDVDSDGEAEIPVNLAFYGYSGSSETPPPIYMTNWYVCRNGLLMREYSSYYAVQEGYIFRMPQRWERRVTAVAEDEEIVFYEFDASSRTEDDEPVLQAPLLRLAVVTDPVAADAMQSEGYVLLRQMSGRYYLGRIEPGSRTLALTESELVTAMRYLD